MSKFATLALLGGVCANARWADFGHEERRYARPVESHYAHYSMPPSREGAHLAYLLGMESNGLSPDQSNSLDEMAAAMASKNAEYAEDLIDHHQEEIPTFHVVHEQEMNNLMPNPAPSKSPRREEAPHHMALNQADISSPSSTSSDSEETETSAPSTETSSTSSTETSDSEQENDIAHIPFKPKPGWTIDDGQDGSSSEEDTSSFEEEVNYTIPRLSEELQSPQKPLKPTRQEKRKSKPQREKVEYDLEDMTLAMPAVPSLGSPHQPHEETRGPTRHHTEYPHVPNEETVAREIEQLRSMVDDHYDHEMEVTTQVTTPYRAGTITEDDTSDEDADDEGEAAKPAPVQEEKYDVNKFSQKDLEALKDIRARAAPVKERRDIKEAVDREDVKTLTHSLDYAESQLQDRLRKNLDMYHDLKKLKEKPHGDFTNQDLKFVKNAVCPDGICFSGALSLSSAAALATTLCLYMF